MKKYSKVKHSDIPFFQNISEGDWKDWKWHLRNAIRDIPTLKQIIEIDEKEERELEQCLHKFNMSITPYYAALMDKKYKRCPVRLQAVPRIQELNVSENDYIDPLHEDTDSPVSGLTHRYPDRVLFLVTRICSMYCRHCTRGGLLVSMMRSSRNSI